MAHELCRSLIGLGSSVASPGQDVPGNDKDLEIAFGTVGFPLLIHMFAV